MLTTEQINKLLGINESYKAPDRLMEILFDEKVRKKSFESFLELESDLSYELFQSYFEDEHADRKNKKQDFTPLSVSKVMSQLCDEESEGYFESAAGNGGIMIQYWNTHKDDFYTVEELSDRSIPFLLFNMMIRNISGIVRHGDSLTQDWKRVYRIRSGERFSDIEIIENKEHSANTILMNPPYSSPWSANQEFLKDDRFKDYVKLAPKSKADFAFLLHGFSKLKENGMMAVVLPHGVLFRGAAEGAIRQKLIENGSIDAIIGLPANLFYGTSIPTTIIILRKNRTQKDVMFIDASKEFEKGKNQNSLTAENMSKIVETYQKRVDIEKYSHLASFEEVQENDFNLNIPRFVDTFEEEEPINLSEVANEVIKLNEEIANSEFELLQMLNQLVASDDEGKQALEDVKRMFKPVDNQTKLF